VVVASSVVDAVAASSVVVVCVVDYAAVRSFLSPGDVAGRTVVNLTNGTPQQARSASRLFESYVDGGIMAVPSMIGLPGSLVLYSGSSSAFLLARPVLEVFGEARFLGEDPGRAALYDLALLSGMYGMFGGVYHALALTASEDLDVRPLLKDWLLAMLAVLPDGSDRSDSSLAMQAAAYVNLLDASRDQGVRTDMVVAMGDLLARGAAAEPGVSLVELLRR
jgi:hypothetical protein